ncbi:MAG: phosphoribosyltransferase family protein [Candidatus Kapaibacterium sp.]
MSNNIKDIISNKSTALFNDVVDFLYPKICIVSDLRIPEENSNDFVIDRILQSFEIINEDEFSFMRSKINADFFFSKYAFRHESGIQSLIHYLKYRGFTKIGTFLGSIIGTELKLHHSEKLKGYNYLLPVPLHSGKLRERGFNQSMYICKGIVEVLPFEILNENIIRVKNTKSQTGLSFEERIANVRDAFDLNPKLKTSELKSGILVVDDVITTGSTIKEVIRMLKQDTSVSVGAVTIGLAK